MADPRETHDLEVDGLRVRFIFATDRFAHEVWIAGERGWLLALRSLEGTPAQAWPPSPPLQSLDLDRNTLGRQLGLLVGMAGVNHWSASFELAAAPACLRVEFACRVRPGESPRLGNQYQIVGRVLDANERRAVVAAPNGNAGRLCLELDDGFAAARLEVGGDLLSVVPAIPGPVEARGSQTIRWAFRITLPQSS